MTTLPINRRGLIGAVGLTLAGLATLRWPSAAASAPTGRFAVMHSPVEWRKMLGAQRYAVLRQGSTERPYSSPLDKEKHAGVFTCAGCALPLFASATKFDSGTGWPSFWKALPRAVATKTDRSMLMARTEALCSRCGGHLGHVFDDGPKPTGLRYCMNGLALRFRAA